MALTLVIGAQWGDEGKGKIIDYLSQTQDFIVRHNGGNNAGHTIINSHGTFALHLLPSGVFNPKAKIIISNGVVLDLETLISEIEMLQKAGIKTKGRLFISPRCHIILPYHKLLEKAYENAKRHNKVGTTGRGIGPVHADKISYNGIRLFDLLDKKLFSEKLKTQLLVKNKILKSLGEKPISQEDIEKKYFSYLKKIKDYLQEPYTLVNTAISKNKKVLLEGAQGVFLDNDWGTYPFVTATTTLSGGITAQTGISPLKIGKIIGVTKAYTTRVGSGPFPTELENNVGEKLRNDGGEFGATTGRARRCGWLDLELVKFSASMNGFTELAITKLDILDSFKEIKVCMEYKFKGKKVNYWDISAEDLEKITPVYKIFKGWETSTKGINKYEDLPKEAKIYLQFIEKETRVKISYISTGAKREETILKNK